MAEHFNAATTPFQQGISLIEASAGTGKTYTIAMLVLRLVVELDISIDKALVVTFTKAATEELKDRIRSRLADAKRVLVGKFDEPTISTWLAQVNLHKAVIKLRLDKALLDIDQAGIFTIHGFCQRVLREHALASGQLFDAELTDDLAAVKQTCADDFWRRQVQNRQVSEVALLTQHFKTPDELLKSVANISDEAVVFPELHPIDTALRDLQVAVELAKTSFDHHRQIVLSALEGKQFNASFKANFTESLNVLFDWFQGNSTQLPDSESLTLLTYQGLYEGLNGSQFRGNQRQTSDERKAEFLTSLNLNFKPFDELVGKVQDLTVSLRLNLLQTLRMELDKQLTQLNQWSFDNLITHLAKALQGEHSQHLISELRQRFQAALIDEFQDTDNHQWHIFSTLFAVNSHYLVLVGDPKQAIYKFRGADIYSYLAAQNQAQQHYTLAKNWRSHPLLVAATNRLFQREHAFVMPEITFNPIEAAQAEHDRRLCQHHTPCPPMVIWQLPESTSKSGYWSAGQAAQAIQLAVANEILGLLTDGYTLDYQENEKSRNVQPKDIAILVRNNQHARDYQATLRSVGVPSVLNSTESVFASNEAFDLFVLLQAVAHPGNINRVGQALALNWFGFDGQALYRILNNEAEIGNILGRFQGYYQTWQQAGIMAMMTALLNQEKVIASLTRTALAERRLTNLQHILELLQQAVIEEHLGLHKTLDWLKAAIGKAQDSTGSPENQQLRLESDADAVKIITMHRAKGLEYPIVFCPYLWQGNQRINSKNPLVTCHLPDNSGSPINRLVVDLGSDRLEHHQAQARFEEKAEDIRLAYVALTRAKYRCYIVWADIRSEAKSNESALSWLLDFADHDFSGQQATLQSLQTENHRAFAYRLLDITKGITGSYRQVEKLGKLTARKRLRSLYTNWQMSSYTALSALSTTETPELPQDKADEGYIRSSEWVETLPTGAQTGNVIHELLETNDFADLAKTKDISQARDKACQRYGLKLSQPEFIETVLYNTVATPLSETDIQFTLMNIPDERCLKEMPFYLSMSALETQKLNALLRSQASFQPLNHKQMSGFLTGFIDLICEYQGKFYVMDYKTNSLLNYQHDTLTHAMREHNYGLQYWLYCVVLHQYLQQRLPDYDFDRHFGGVRYLFVRGMNPSVAMSGVFTDHPDAVTLKALSKLFSQ